MSENRNAINEAKRRAVVEGMWLHYYNNMLLEHGLITEEQHRRLAAMVSSRRFKNNV